jgi:hypothetical protein
MTGGHDVPVVVVIEVKGTILGNSRSLFSTVSARTDEDARDAAGSHICGMTKPPQS